MHHISIKELFFFCIRYENTAAHFIFNTRVEMNYKHITTPQESMEMHLNPQSRILRTINNVRYHRPAPCQELQQY